jgi:TatA/E family protein of Tat protein translocase
MSRPVGNRIAGDSTMPFGLGFGETILILAVILLFFGPKRLPEAAASLGKGIREFKNAFSGIGDEINPSRDLASTPLPPHSTLAGTGADPYAVALETPEPLPPPADPATERRPEDPPA